MPIHHTYRKQDKNLGKIPYWYIFGENYSIIQLKKEPRYTKRKQIFYHSFSSTDQKQSTDAINMKPTPGTVLGTQLSGEVSYFFVSPSIGPPTNQRVSSLVHSVSSYSVQMYFQVAFGYTVFQQNNADHQMCGQRESQKTGLNLWENFLLRNLD